MNNLIYFKYLFVMAGVTYLIRALPFALFTKQIKSKYIKSFLAYIPYSVLTAMTVPAIFFATGSVISAAVGFAVAIGLAVKGKDLITVALAASAVVLIVDLIL
ncbi:MAG: AzlD domain-containing protein [Eubacterium sp.]|nr:AzlD domain-containing protein [Eubacterium sp.]